MARERPFWTTQPGVYSTEDDAGRTVYVSPLGRQWVETGGESSPDRRSVAEVLDVVRAGASDVLADPVGAATSALRGAAAGAAGVVSAPTDPDFSLSDVWDVALSMPAGGAATSGGRAAVSYDPATAQMLIGPNSAKWSRLAEREAKRLEGAGYGPREQKTITYDKNKDQTGVYRQGDRFVAEIDPKINESTVRLDPRLAEVLDGKNRMAYMDELLPDSPMYEHYPDLKNYTVTFRPKDPADPGMRGAHYVGNNQIDIYIRDPSEFDPDYVAEVLNHELEHGVQMREKVSSGSNPHDAVRVVGESMEPVMAELDSYVRSPTMSSDRRDFYQSLRTALGDYRDKLMNPVGAHYRYTADPSEVEARQATARQNMNTMQRQMTMPDERPYSAPIPPENRFRTRSAENDILPPSMDELIAWASDDQQRAVLEHVKKYGEDLDKAAAAWTPGPAPSKEEIADFLRDWTPDGE